MKQALCIGIYTNGGPTSESTVSKLHQQKWKKKWQSHYRVKYFPQPCTKRATQTTDTLKSETTLPYTLCRCRAYPTRLTARSVVRSWKSHDEYMGHGKLKGEKARRKSWKGEKARFSLQSIIVKLVNFIEIGVLCLKQSLVPTDCAPAVAEHKTSILLCFA